jgi:N-acetylglucosaminyl-diphospho-decaprenol L-rhamnosyltransferase
MAGNIRLTIIIVNWNAGGLLRPCLKSIERAGADLPLEIIIIDNASNDGSCGMIKTEFPHVQLIPNGENVGFSRANNQGLRIAKGEYILLLNPDTLMADPSTLATWLDFMDRHKDVGASGIRLVNPNKRHQVGDAGFKPSLATVTNFSLFLSRAFPRRFRGLFLIYKKLENVMEVDWICGADFLIRREVLSRVGLMDESVFMFAEDIEWGCRIRSCGYKISYLPFLEIIHYQGASSKAQKNQNVFSLMWLARLRQIYRFYNKGYSLLPYDLMMSLAFLLRSILHYLAYLKTRRIEEKNAGLKMTKYFLFSAKQIGLGA